MTQPRVTRRQAIGGVMAGGILPLAAPQAAAAKGTRRVAKEVLAAL